jgi:uncharacterized protein (TIGR03437 family)
MDAAYNPFKKLALLFATALLVAAPSLASTGVTLTSNPTSVVFSPSLGGNTVSVTVTASGAVGTFTVTPSPSPTFFGVTDQTSTPTSVSFIASLTKSCDVSGSCGAGTITVTADVGGSVSIPVSYCSSCSSSGGTTGTAINAFPKPVTLLSASGAAIAIQVSVSTTSTAAVPFSVTNISPSSSWLTVSPSSGTITSGAPATLTVTANSAYPVSLADSVYSGSFTIAANDGSGATVNVPVNYTVGSGNGSGGGGGTSASNLVAPTSLTFSYQAGSATPADQFITVAGSGPYSITTSSTSLNFISASTTTANAPGLVDVSVISASPGTYYGSVSIATSSGTVSVPVTMYVTSSPVILASRGSYNVSWQSGTAPTTDTLRLSASDDSTIAFTAASSDSWVKLASTATPSTPASVQVTIDPSSLSSGLHTATITITAPTAANTPLTIPVVALVNSSSGGGTGPLTLSPTSLTFSAVVNGTQPVSQSLSVSTSPSGTAFSVQTSGSNCGWLAVSPNGTLTTNRTLAVSASISGLSAGTYTCNVSLTSGTSTQTVPVTLTLSSSGGGTTISSNPASLSFTYQQGGVVPDSQYPTISSASGSAGIGVTISVTQGATWLSVSPASASTPINLIVNVNPTGLAGGTYNGTIHVVPNSGTPLDIPVTLTVQSLTISASPTTLTFNYRAGDPAPATQSISVGGGAGLTFSATPTSSGWLKVTPTTGTAPATLTVSVDPSALTTAGQLTGTIVVAGTGTATGSSTVNVTINVTAPLPTINGVTSGASFATSNNISAGEVITIFGTNIGPSTPVGLTLDSSGLVSTNIGGVQVLVGGYPAPMIYASGTQVSAVVPYEIATPVFRVNPSIQVKYLGQTSNGVSVTQVASVPGLFTANSSGSGPGAILNPNNSVNSPSNPANKGDIVVLYMTGEGQTNPAGVTGKVTTVNQNGNPLTPQPLLPVAVLIDGQPASVKFYGEAPGLVSGVMQVNVQIPSTARTGDLPIIVSVGSNSSQNGVTVSVK